MGWELTGFALPLALGLLLVLAGVEDIRHREIAHWQSGGIALLAPLWWWQQGLSPWPGMAAQVALGIVALALFALAYRFGMMGGGDVKLIAALALWFPLDRFVLVLMVMSIAGGVITALMLVDKHLSKRRDIEVPYGVAIAIAGLCCLGEPILNPFA
ncbi:peptidase [Sphingomonas sp. Leaf17]|uniref:A24 family peptidase n=1 Tax=Sphingomonas sp. Leaf17 TaxID=1735683 RepID=UPI0006F69DFA|nr:prepilin peptidase [Sphingomonas sp. Leaf17]KQM63735.1 peptidase [Sphingomonas sp. Leaf17]